jgi:hypothetical protein
MLHPERVQDPEIAPQQYAVVLVDQEQLDQLMRRPAMRRNTGYAPRDVYLRYDRLRRRLAAAAVLLLVLASGGLFWFLAPEPALASMFPWSGGGQAPALATGASFSVTAATVASGDSARRTAAGILDRGLPAFTRLSPGRRQMYQALVGPYATLEEAQKAQRRLGDLGYGRARLFVDESLREAGRASQLVGVAEGQLGVVLLGAPDRLSLVLELPETPRQLSSRRSTPDSLDVDVGPLSTPVARQQWSAPRGVHLLQNVTVQGLTAPSGGDFLRARILLPEFARASVRAEGRRVYVDLTWPSDDDDQRAALPAAPVTSAPRAPQVSPAQQDAAQASAYQDAIAPLVARMAEIRPFLLSAARSGSPDVLGALDVTLAELEGTLKATPAPPVVVGQHQLLLTATQVARQGLAPDFAGDRLAQAHQALAIFDGGLEAAPRD